MTELFVVCDFKNEEFDEFESFDLAKQAARPNETEIIREVYDESGDFVSQERIDKWTLL